MMNEFEGAEFAVESLVEYGSQLPLVSLVMGVHNCEKTVESSIQSLLDQTYPEWELVVCDDGSTDGTFEVLRRLAEAHPARIVLLRNAKNLRLAATLNLCLSRCSGKYVARMDADDLSAPDRLALQVAYLRENPDVDLVGTGMKRFGGVGAGGTVIPPSEPGRYSLKSGSPFCHATIMTYPRVYQELGGYNESKRAERVEDIDLWFRFFQLGFSGRNVMDSLYLVREDEKALSRRTLKNRWNLLLVTYRGYVSLRYPPWWYLRPLVDFLKVLIPKKVVVRYRIRQSRNTATDVR